jgi:hypothetical protein
MAEIQPIRIEIEREEDGRILAAVPNLPGVMAYGGAEDEAIREVKANSPAGLSRHDRGRAKLAWLSRFRCIPAAGDLPSKRGMMATKTALPRFKSEKEEAEWWDAHPETITELFLKARKEGRIKRLPVLRVATKSVTSGTARAQTLH